MTYDFSKEAAALDFINKRIESEWQRYDDYAKDLIARGEHEHERRARGQHFEKMEMLDIERRSIRESMPPFTTWNDEVGCLERHPVTPENARLLD